MYIKRVFRALRHKNYRLFFIGQGVSLVGTWMQNVAMGWLVYRLTNSAFLLGVIGFTSQAPVFFLSPFAGVIADRHNKRKLLIATQIVEMAQAGILAVLVLSHTVATWHIVVLSILLGVANAFDMPVRHAFTVEMIENKEDLGNAIALNSILFNSARLIGPSIAGILIAFFGEGVCFAVNSVSYAAVIVALFMMSMVKKRARSANEHILQDLKEGISYVAGSKPIRHILILLAFISFLGIPYHVLLPVFARDVFHGGPETLGFMAGTIGLGALLGAGYLAGRKNFAGLGRTIAFSAVLFSAALICFALSRILWIALPVLFIAGFGMMVMMAESNTILQTISDEDKVGRVMSYFTIAFMGMAPLGSLFAGYLAAKIGASNALLYGSICCLVCAGFFIKQLPSLKQNVKALYIKKGIFVEAY